MEVHNGAVSRHVLALLLISAVAAGCGGSEQKSSDDQKSKTQRAAPVLGPGGLVDVGGGRRLYLDCAGSGSPTVVLEAGFGGGRLSWVSVQPELPSLPSSIETLMTTFLLSLRARSEGAIPRCCGRA
jgi:hypothetical protein